MPGRQLPPSRLAVVYLDHEAAMGNKPRVRTWGAIGRAAGLDTVFIGLRPAIVPRPSPSKLRDLLRGDAVAESVIWSQGALRSRIAAEKPDVVVFVTARVFDAKIARSVERPIVDFVDELSASYRMRSTSDDSTLLRRITFKSLYLPMRRFETRPRTMARTTAGHRDAANLQARWVPNLISGACPVARRSDPRHDLVFVGSLNYEPNIEALKWFEPVWRELRRRRPEISLLVAGAYPSAHTLAWLWAVPGWHVMPNFRGLDDVLSDARLSIAPIQSATGFPNKVFEAAERDVPQVISPVAAQGLDPAFPACRAATAEDWVRQVLRLLDNPAEAEALGHESRRHVLSHYAPEQYAGIVLGRGPDQSDGGSR